MLQPYIESVTALSDDIDVQEFCRTADVDFQHFDGPRNMSVALKSDVLCLWVFVYGIPAWVGRSNGLNFVIVGETTCAKPT